MNPCAEIRLLLGPFDDGELEPHEMEDVALHVVSCADCKAELEDYRSLGVGLRATVVAPPLEGFAQNVVAQLQPRHASVRKRVARWWESLGWVPSMVEFATVSVATAVLTLWIAGPGVRRFVANHEGTSRVLMVASVPHGSEAPANGEGAVVLASAASATAGHPAVPNANTASENLANVMDQGKLEAASDMQEMLAEMGAGQSPSVAVWNEPHTDTTVVWVPDLP